MQFKPLLIEIENIIRASAANALIRVYRHYVIEPGVHSVPALVIGSRRDITLDESFLGDSAGARPVLWEVSLGISALTRRYPLPAQVVNAAEELDALQAAIFTALNADSTQNEACEQSWIKSIREISLLNGEYEGYELLLILQKFEP